MKIFLVQLLEYEDVNKGKYISSIIASYFHFNLFVKNKNAGALDLTRNSGIHSLFQILLYILPRV